MKLCCDEAVMAPRSAKEGNRVEFWHKETDYFALMLFLMMLFLMMLFKNKRMNMLLFLKCC